MDRSPGSFMSPMSNEPRLRAVSESPGATGGRDDWGESPSDRLASTQGSPSRWRTQRGALRDSRSAPLLPAAQSSCTSTWYSSSNRSTTLHGAPMWQALGNTWRTRSKDEFGDPIRRNVDEANMFQQGCVPNWNKMHMRKFKILEHELTWAYYRMRRHALHPQRKEVGDPHMPPQCVVEKMRFGSENKFQFWRDLRPPFVVRQVRRVTNEPESGSHPDGDLFKVTYQCGIDYVSERLWNEKSDGGTFDNKIQGVAIVRIPDEYPKQRTITIDSWGQPSLNSSHWGNDDEEEGEAPAFVDPNVWMPISQELDLPANLPRFAGCREATRKAVSRRPVEMPALQRLLLGPHASLPRLAMSNSMAPGAAAAATTGAEGDAQGATPSPKKNKKRQHRIFTAAAGFVRYAG